MNTAPNRPGMKGDSTDATFETPRREGGDDALAERDPSNSRMDEKVIVNTQRESKIINAPSQTEAHPEGEESVDEQ